MIFVNALIIFCLTYLVWFCPVMDLGLIRTDVWCAALLSYNELTEISFVLHVFCQVVYFEWYLCVISKPVGYVCRWIWRLLTWHFGAWLKMVAILYTNDKEALVRVIGLVPSHNRPLPEPMLARSMTSYDVTWPHWKPWHAVSLRLNGFSLALPELWVRPVRIETCFKLECIGKYAVV